MITTIILWMAIGFMAPIHTAEEVGVTWHNSQEECEEQVRDARAQGAWASECIRVEFPAPSQRAPVPEKA